MPEKPSLFANAAHSQHGRFAFRPWWAERPLGEMATARILEALVFELWFVVGGLFAALWWLGTPTWLTVTACCLVVPLLDWRASR